LRIEFVPERSGWMMAESAALNGGLFHSSALLNPMREDGRLKLQNSPAR
jgi:hypothetical protein